MLESTLVSGRLVLLSNLLAAATLAGDADWESAGTGADTYAWERSEGSVSIGSRDRDGEPPYRLVVFNADGVAVDELVSQLIENDRPAPWNTSLTTLYRAARRSALHADDVLDALLAELQPVNASTAR
jgi:hypothetical protein